MTTLVSPVVRYTALLVLIVLSSILARPAYGDYYIAGGKNPVRRIAIEGGVFELRGGLEVTAPLFPGFKKSRGRPEGLSFSLLVYASNKSTNTVWVEVEVQISETEEALKKLEKIKANNRHGFMWKLKEVAWNKEYPFTVSVFADENRTRLLGSTKTFFSFQEQTARQTLEQYNSLLWMHNGGYPMYSKDRLLIAGWKDEQVATKGGESSEGWIEGTVADATLQLDIKKMISTLESAFHPGCELQVVKQVRSGSKTGLERWSVKSCEVVTQYEVRMKPSPRGGTDFEVTRSTKEAAAQDASFP